MSWGKSLNTLKEDEGKKEKKETDAYVSVETTIPMK